MLIVKRKPGESVGSLIRRFSSSVVKSGVLIESQKRARRQPFLSETEKKEKALRRLKRKKEVEEELIK